MMVFEKNDFSVQEIFKSLNVMLLRRAQEKNLELVFSCEEDVPDVLLGDQTRLSQIIINLVGNAIKFTNTGSVRVLAKIRQVVGENILVEFSITDTGIGIPKDKLATIFE